MPRCHATNATVFLRVKRLSKITPSISNNKLDRKRLIIVHLVFYRFSSQICSKHALNSQPQHNGQKENRALLTERSRQNSWAIVLVTISNTDLISSNHNVRQGNRTLLCDSPSKTHGEQTIPSTQDVCNLLKYNLPTPIHISMGYQQGIGKLEFRKYVLLQKLWLIWYFSWRSHRYRSILTSSSEVRPEQYN